ncbi:type VII secretion protein EccB [Mycobacterium sp. NPDC003449]
MARQPATRLQLSGYRFLLRRTMHALVRGDARMLDDPQRAQSISFTAGCVLAAVAIIGSLVLAVVRPGGALGSAPILIDRDSGALYVQVDGTVHPVPNLASARLIAGAPADPEPVGAGVLAAARRGPMLGIMGAPIRIDPPLTADESGWTVCDIAEPAGTVLTAGRPGAGLRSARRSQAVLVSPRGEGAANTYLLYDGRRARVDLRSIAVVRALRLEGIAPVPVSRSLLDGVPEAPAVQAPVIAAPGTPGPPALGGPTVGTVVRLARADAAEFYIVLGNGLQRVGRVVADLVRFTVPQPAGGPPEIAADVVARVPFVQDLVLGPLPERVQAGAGIAVCAGWDPLPSGTDLKTGLYLADSLRVWDTAIELAQQDGAGPNLDRIGIPAGRSALVRATGLAGESTTTGARYLVDDLGVLFGIRDDETAASLGLAGPAVEGPWPMLALLPRGPELSRAAASVLRDGARAAP